MAITQFNRAGHCPGNGEFESVSGRPDRLTDYNPAVLIEEFDRRDRILPGTSHGWQSGYYQFVQTQTARAVLCVLAREHGFSLSGKRILDVGCGAGGWLLEFTRWGADPPLLAGIDLNPRRIAQARQRLPLAGLREGDARKLPWPRGEFDLAIQFTVLSSILSPTVRQEVAAEMLRVVRPGGMILLYDMRINNPRNRSVRAVTGAEIRRLFPGCPVELRSTTLAPPISRRVVPVAWILALALEKVPFLRTHYLAVIRKPCPALGP